MYSVWKRHNAGIMNLNDHLPPQIETLLNSRQTPEKVLEELLALVGKTLQADRCFLYLRDPDKETGKIAFCWCRNHSIPDVTESEWKNDTKTLPLEDPLFAAALRSEPSRYIEDVTTADPIILNLAFENKTFGHRALIHAHITDIGKLWGILQPAIFGRPHSWSAADRQLIEALLPQMVRWVKKYITGPQQKH